MPDDKKNKDQADGQENKAAAQDDEVVGKAYDGRLMRRLLRTFARTSYRRR